jgi:predicted pyridoxine 5'-phosphate oxidase superfamily flavin-nucleotide-binding protein
MLTVLDDDMKRVVREQRLGYVATVCPDGTPNVSPKGTTAVWDDEHLVFLDLYSPGTVANIEAGHPVVEVNVVDPIRRKGYRFKGPAQVHREGSLFDDVVQRYERERGTDRRRINSVVLVRVERAAPLVSPAYADGSSEATIEQRSLDMYGLMRTPRLNSP